MKLWEIWSEGWTGHESEFGLAQKLGEEQADSFQSACDQFFNRQTNFAWKKDYKSDGLYHWGMKLHDSECGAREFERKYILPRLGS